MDLCGNIYVSKDLSIFSLKCSKCEQNLTEWPEFVEHIRNCLESDTNDEPYIDVPNENYLESKLVVVDIVEPRSIKKEEDLVINEALDDLMSVDDNDEVEETLKCEVFEDDAEISITETDLPAGETAENDDFFDDEFSADSSSSDDSSTYRKKKKLLKDATKQFTPSFYRHNKCTPFFIDLYKSQACLWDENHADFTNPAAHKAAYKTMSKSIERNFHVVLKEHAIKSLITRIRQQYYSTQENIKVGLRSKLKSIVKDCFKMCSFLGEIDEKRDDDPKTGSLGTKIKCIAFSSLSKDAIETLLDGYKNNSVLHDGNHPEFCSTYKRGLALTSIVEALRSQHNVELTTERISIILRNFREWYYKLCDENRKGEKLSAEEHYYLDRCSFFPSKVKRKKFSCNHCDFIASSEKILQVHMFEAHQIGNLPHKCEECNRFFRQKSSLVLHNQRSHSDKKFECEYCDRKFSVIADYRLHVRTHTEEKPYVCELCGKAFRIRTQLGYHMTAIHTKIRAFKCNLCPKDFLKAVHLRDHIKSHLNIRDKICETCGKGFTNCHSLIRHRQIHSAVKKFECKLCDAKFHQFVGLNSHMKRTHNIVKNKPKNE